MKVTILGSGTCVPRLERSASAVLIEAGDLKLLLDMGPGTMRRMLEYGVEIFDLTHIFLTHFHPDHSAELAPLIFASKYAGVKQRRSRLSVYAGPGVMTFYNNLKMVYGDWIVLPENLLAFGEIDAGSNEAMDLGAVRVTFRPVAHRPESLAYRIEDGQGRSVVYSGDTDVCDSLAELAHGADLFICESAFPDEQKSSGHLTPSLAGQIAQAARVRRLILTHLYPPCDQVDIVRQASGAYTLGPIVAAEDLMSFDMNSFPPETGQSGRDQDAGRISRGPAADSPAMNRFHGTPISEKR